MPANKISKKEQRRQELARAKRRKRLLYIVPIAVIVGLLIGVAVYRIFQPDLEGVVAFSNLSREHDVDAVFPDDSLPPAGGTHHPTWQNCGIYDQPLDNKHAVHALEHGAVWIAYNPQLPPEEIAQLQDIARGETYLLLSPYPELIDDVVLTSWGKQLVVEGTADERIQQFIDRYRGEGPESGAACTGGTGQPIG